MPVFRGNVGNLMQHWVLCELMAACTQHYDGIMFIDAHAMAPLATERPRRDQTAHWFDRIRERLPGERSPYENAWHALASNGVAYPNSANFVTALWTGSYSLVLCESDQATAHELEAWAATIRGWPRCLGVEVAPGDWRERFRLGFALPHGLTFLSFDPYMFNRHGAGNPGQMGPADLAVAVAPLAAVSGPVLVQLTTYDVNNDNAQSEVEPVVTKGFGQGRLQLLALVKANNAMMSLVYGRDVNWAGSLASLPSRFKGWLSRMIGSV